MSAMTPVVGRLCHGAPQQGSRMCISRSVCSIRPVSSFVHPFAAQISDYSTRQGSLADSLGGQLSVGSVLGFATGYSIKRIGQLILVVIGSEVIALQLMARRGWVVVNWSAISREFDPHIEKHGVDRILHTLRFRIPFAGAFTAGVYAGLRWT